MRCAVCSRPINQNERTKLDAHGELIHVRHHEADQATDELPGSSPSSSPSPAG